MKNSSKVLFAAIAVCFVLLFSLPGVSSSAQISVDPVPTPAKVSSPSDGVEEDGVEEDGVEEDLFGPEEEILSSNGTVTAAPTEVPTTARKTPCRPGWIFIRTPRLCLLMDVKEKVKACRMGIEEDKCYTERMRCKKGHTKLSPTTCEKNARGVTATPAIRCDLGWTFNLTENICTGREVFGKIVYNCTGLVKDGHTFNKLRDDKCRWETGYDFSQKSWRTRCDFNRQKINWKRTGCESIETMDATATCVKGTPEKESGDCVETRRQPVLRCAHIDEKLEGESCQLKVRYSTVKVCYRGTPGDCATKVEVEGRMECPCDDRKTTAGTMVCPTGYPETVRGTCEKQDDIDDPGCRGMTITADGFCE